MGEAKKIDVTGLSALCRKWLPAFRAAEHLCNISIAGVLDSEKYVSLADIVAESKYKASGTYRIVSMAVRAGLVEKPDGGGPLYRATPLMKDVLDAHTRAEALYTISTHCEILNALGKNEFNQSALCLVTGTQQTTMSLQMKRLHIAGWVTVDRMGKRCGIRFPDYARQIMPVVAAELRVLE